jgi:hypothetical protein
MRLNLKQKIRYWLNLLEIVPKWLLTAFFALTAVAKYTLRAQKYGRSSLRSVNVHICVHAIKEMDAVRMASMLLSPEMTDIKQSTPSRIAISHQEALRRQSTSRWRAITKGTRLLQGAGSNDVAISPGPDSFAHKQIWPRDRSDIVTSSSFRERLVYWFFLF